jgi:hypothetical protein
MSTAWQAGYDAALADLRLLVDLQRRSVDQAPRQIADAVLAQCAAMHAAAEALEHDMPSRLIPMSAMTDWAARRSRPPNPEQPATAVCADTDEARPDTAAPTNDQENR